MNYDELISSEVSPEDVCGTNLEDDSSFQNFFFESEGTPERFDGQTTTPAEPPDWRIVKKNSLSFIKRTRDLKLISILAQSVLNTEGIIKFEECLNGLSKLVTSQWKELYPPLDEDDNDPMERISALGHLTDKAFIINVLKTLPIINSKVLGNISLQLIDRAADPSIKKNSSDIEITQVKGVFNDNDNNDLLAIYNATTQCLKHLNHINQTFTENSGHEYSVNFDSIAEVFTHLSKTIEKYGNIQTSIIEDNIDSNNNTSSVNDNELNTTKHSLSSEPKMNIQAFDSNNIKLSSRQDVEHCFDLICSYYEEFEPSSPIPILIKRSQKLVNLDFLDIVKDIFPDALEQVHKLGGIPERTSDKDNETKPSSSGSSW